MQSKANYSERRKAQRYDMYLPVHFHIKDSKDDNSPESMKYFQGFTKNFSEGGLLIEALNLSQPQLRTVENLEAHIEGSILIPTHPKPVRFQARPAWSKREDNQIELIGLYFTDIKKNNLDTLLDFAMMINKKTRVSTLITTIIINTIIALIVMALFFHLTFSNIISRQTKTIEKLQNDQKELRCKLKSIFSIK